MFKDYYKILGIYPPTTEREIKSAYIKQSLKYHPDKNPNEDTTAQMQEINEAYLILKDSEARFRYDKIYFKFKNEMKSGNISSESKYDNTNDNEYQYEFYDDVLKKWMSNAKRQAEKMKYEVVDEVKGSTRNILSILLPFMLGYILLKSCSA